MIHDTLSKIESRIGQSGVKDDAKAELLTLLGTLKSEVAELSKTHGEAAQSIASTSPRATGPALRPHSPITFTSTRFRRWPSNSP